MSSALLLALLPVCVPVSEEGATALEIGAPAPPIVAAGVLGAPADLELSWESLRGSVVVLEFWSTTCSPCIPALDHLASVDRELGDEPVVFLGISPEEEERMETFLGRKEVAFPVVLDRESATFDAYGVHVIPHTVIVDAGGRIAASTKPELVTVDVLRRVLRGEPAGLEVESFVPTDIEWSPESGQLGELFARCVIAPSNASGGGHRFEPGSGRISGDGVHRDNMIQLAWEVSHARILSRLSPWSAEDPRYKLSLLAPGGDDDLARRILRGAVQEKFGLVARWEEREVDLYVLTVSPDVELVESTAPASLRGGSANGGGLNMVGTKLEFVRSWSENILQRPVIDDTGLEGRYDLDLEWVDRETFFLALGDVGLELVPDRGPVRMLVVEPRPADE